MGVQQRKTATVENHARMRAPDRHEHVAVGPAPASRQLRARSGRRAAAADEVEVDLFAFSPGTAATRARRASCAAAPGRRALRLVHAHFGLDRVAGLSPARRALVVTLHGTDLLPPALRPTRARRCRSSTSPRPSRAAFAPTSRRRPDAARRGAPRAASTSTRFRPDPARRGARRLGLDPDGPVPAVPRTTRRGRSSASTAPSRRPATAASHARARPSAEVPY